MVGQPYSGKLNVRLDERREDAGNRCLPPTLHCNVYVRSRRAGERVMGLLGRLYAGLRLHMAFPIRYFDHLGVPRLAAQPQLPEPPGADPHAGWCGRGPRRSCGAPMPIIAFDGQSRLSGRLLGRSLA
jgi:hypothetical protein